MPQYAEAKHSEVSCLEHDNHLSPLLSLLSTAEARRVLRTSPDEHLLLWPKFQLHAKCCHYVVTAETGVGCAHAIQHTSPGLLSAHLSAPTLLCWHW